LIASSGRGRKGAVFAAVLPGAVQAAATPPHDAVSASRSPDGWGRLNFMEAFRSKFKILPWIVREECVIRIPNDLGRIQPLAMYLGEHAVVIGRCDPKREKQVVTALTEALTNAIVHGNLEISSDLRDEDCGRAFQAIIEQRRQTLPYRDRSVEVFAEVNNGSVSWTITDEGKGFDVRSLPDPTDPDNLLRCSGRGVLLMKAFSDELIFNERGNQVRITVFAPKHAPTTNG
jgi:anti-sigma regulatory factor (Ser/Thr protein kinase)